MTRPTKNSLAGLALMAMTAAPTAAACSDPTTHVLVGNPFNPTATCLGASMGFDVADGPAPGDSCAPTCVVDAKSGTTYVTVTCPPYPPLDTVEAADAAAGAADVCAAALAAWQSMAVCSSTATPDASAADSAVQPSPDASAARETDGAESDAVASDVGSD